MRELIFLGPGKLEWRDAEEPALREPDDALVRPLAVARCDLDAALLRGASPVPGPFAFGHECVAEVVRVGPQVTVAAPGDRVIVAFQIACGACARCLRGHTANCTAVAPMSMFGLGARGTWGGVIRDLVRVPFANAMLVRAPAGAALAALASASDNVADGYRTVARHLAETPRAPVLVVGGGAASVGLYAVAAAVALGAERVDFLDRDPQRLAIAERLGARPIEADHARRAERYPITVDASADPAGLALAVTSTEPRGVCTSVGIYYDDRTPMPLFSAYTAGITFLTGRVDARAELPAVLDLIERGALRADLVTSRTAAWDDAIEALADPGPKVVLVRD
jgi:threonine dehydrogenase-like Zn-dependent dehydrogenase